VSKVLVFHPKYTNKKAAANGHLRRETNINIVFIELYWMLANTYELRRTATGGGGSLERGGLQAQPLNNREKYRENRETEGLS
jgi:hypothetical protein